MDVMGEGFGGFWGGVGTGCRGFGAVSGQVWGFLRRVWRQFGGFWGIFGQFRGGLGGFWGGFEGLWLILGRV